MKELPGKGFTQFSIVLDRAYYEKDMIIGGIGPTKLKVLSAPKVSFWNILLNILTFGWYPIKYKYKVKIVYER